MSVLAEMTDRFAPPPLGETVEQLERLMRREALAYLKLQPGVSAQVLTAAVLPSGARQVEVSVTPSKGRPYTLRITVEVYS